MNSVSQLNFAQPERRNLIVPIAVAVVFLGAAATIILHFIPKTNSDLTIVHTATWQAHTVFKTESIVVGQDKAEDDLYVATVLHIQDHLRVPLFIKDFTSVLTTETGEIYTASAVEKLDIPPLYESFPALKSLSSAPLLRETSIEPGQSGEGMVLLHFQTTQDVWKRRQSATLTVDFYHQPPETITIPLETKTPK